MSLVHQLGEEWAPDRLQAISGCADPLAWAPSQHTSWHCSVGMWKGEKDLTQTHHQIELFPRGSRSVNFYKTQAKDLNLLPVILFLSRHSYSSNQTEFSLLWLRITGPGCSQLGVGAQMVMLMIIMGAYSLLEFICIISFHPHNNSMPESLLFPPFWRNWG